MSEACVVVLTLQGSGQRQIYGAFVERNEAARCARYHTMMHPGDTVEIEPLQRPIVGQRCVLVSGRTLSVA